MKHKQIEYSRVLTAVGRNGASKQAGIDLLMNDEKHLVLQPINSRGGITNAMMQIPFEEMLDFISACQKMYIKAYQRKQAQNQNEAIVNWATPRPMRDEDDDFEAFRQGDDN